MSTDLGIKFANDVADTANDAVGHHDPSSCPEQRTADATLLPVTHLARTIGTFAVRGHFKRVLRQSGLFFLSL